MLALILIAACQSTSSLHKTSSKMDAPQTKTSLKPRLVRTFRYEGGATALNVLQDGRLLAAGGAYGRVTIWRVSTGETLRVLRPSVDSDLADNFVNAIASSVAGDKLAFIHGDSQTMEVFDLATGRRVTTIASPDSPLEWVKSVAFSPDGKLLALGGGMALGTVCVCDASSGAILSREAGGHRSLVRDVAFSPDGKQLVTADWRGAVRVWPVEKGKLLEPRRIQRGSGVYLSRFSADGVVLVTASEDDVCLWDASSLALRRCMPHREYTFAELADLSVELPHVYRMGSSLGFWHVVLGRWPWFKATTGSSESEICHIAVASDGVSFALALRDGTIRYWRLSSRDTAPSTEAADEATTDD